MARQKASERKGSREGAFGDEMRAVGEALLELGLAHERYKREGNELVDIRLKAPSDEGGEWLVVIRASFEGTRYVGFHSSFRPEEAVRGAVNRVLNGQMKWREETPYGR